MDNQFGLPPRKPGRRGRGGLNALLGLILAALLANLVVISFDFIRNLPGTETMEPNFGGLERPVFIGGEMLDANASGSGDSLALPLDLIKEHIDPAITYDEPSDSVIITTKDKVIQMKTGQLTAAVNNEPLELHFPVRRAEEGIWVPVQPLLSIYDMRAVETESGAVLLQKGGDVLRWVEVPAPLDPQEGEKQRKAAVRNEPDIKSPILWQMEAGERAMLLEETENGWFRVQGESGYLGYVNKTDVRLADVEVLPKTEQPEPYIPWKPLGGKINMTWEAVYGRNPDPASIPDMPGLNVISPTWFSLKEDGNGEIYIHNMADKGYVNWAHQRGYQVWALFSNDFDPDLTTKALADYGTRQKIIFELLSLAELYDLQGINIDFENVYLEDKDNLTQFVRELTPYMHEQDLVVSIDVTVRGGSEMWSLFADREALGRIVDYMIVMTYDQHWQSSPVAGSVAELPWTEKGIVDIIEMDHVPPEKILLGVPFYTYQWFEEYKDGEMAGISSKARSMEYVQSLIREKGLKPVYLEDVGQHYVEYEEDGKRVRIWIEDAASMKSRAELVNKLGLAGIASWRRGFETPDIWEVIKDTLEQRP